VKPTTPNMARRRDSLDRERLESTVAVHVNCIHAAVMVEPATVRMSLKTRMIPPTIPANRNICSTPLYEANHSVMANSSPDVVVCVYRQWGL
jgi:hypothetical protein